jgi:hypothetical protein
MSSVPSADDLGRERIKDRELVGCKRDVYGLRVLFQPLDSLGAWDRYDWYAESIGLVAEPRQRDLCWVYSARVGDRADGGSDRLIGLPGAVGEAGVAVAESRGPRAVTSTAPVRKPRPSGA